MLRSVSGNQGNHVFMSTQSSRAELQPVLGAQVVDGQVQCPYHGWEYSSTGECTKMPSTVFCPGVTVASLPCSEKDGARPAAAPLHTCPGRFTRRPVSLRSSLSSFP